MSGAWTRGRLGDVCRVIPGYAFKSSDWQDSGIPVVKIKNIRGDNTVDLSESDCVPESLLTPRLQKFVLKDGDILVAMTGATAGKVGRVRTDRPVLLNQRVAKISPVEADHEFIWAVVSSDEYQKAFFYLADGAAQPNMSGGQIEAVVIPLPPIPVQRRIAGILSAYDDLIENCQRRIKILESMARALYREWFVNFRFPGHEDHPRVASPLGEIPQGWKVRDLQSLMAEHIGGGWGKEAPDGSSTEPAWVIRGTDIPGARSGQVSEVPHRFHTASNLRSRRLVAGDIVFEVSGGSKGQPVGRALLITPQLLSAFDGDVMCASFCKRIRPDVEGYGSEFLYLSLLEAYDSGEIEQFQVQSTGISNFKWTEYISQTQRAVPPAMLRSRFKEAVAPLFAQIATFGLIMQNLRRTRDLLLPRLLSGQAEVEAA